MPHDIKVTRSQHVAISINDIASYEAYVNERIAKREVELKAIHAGELALATEKSDVLRDRIALLLDQQAEDRRRLQDVDAAFAEFRATIEKLEGLLTEATNATAKIGENRIADAKAAVEQGDYRAADAIFAEVQDIENAAIIRSADAAFGRALIAETEIRWHDAATHYATAARLNPTFSTLRKASEFTRRAGNASAAFRYGEDLLAIARKDSDQTKLTFALNEHGLTLAAQGRYGEAEALYTQAIEIGRKTVGEAHPNFATNLNNLATVVQAQGRYLEAEVLFTHSLEIGRKTIGEVHPAFAIRLNNLAIVLHAVGRYAEAEALLIEALEIGRKTIGDAHPDFATHFNNLAAELHAQGRFAEAEALFTQAIEIDRKTIGEAHPSFANRLNNLAGAVWAQGRYVEADPLYAQALAIARKSLGDTHPNTQGVAIDYVRLLQSHRPDAAELPDLLRLAAG